MRTLFAGLGGGLDIVNALPLYLEASRAGDEAYIGAIRTAPLSVIEGYEPISDNAAFLNKDSTVAWKPGSRYAEPRVAEVLHDEVVYLSRLHEGKEDPTKLREAIDAVRSRLGIESFVFACGGGDALTFEKGDIPERAESKDPFEGGDAVALEALAYSNDTYIGVVAVGLDITPSRFHYNKGRLELAGAYVGKMNLRTGEVVGNLPPGVSPLGNQSRRQYSHLAKKILQLSEEDRSDPNKFLSHTATTTFHAINGNFGRQDTFAPWCPIDDQGRGVHVNDSHAWMYFFRAGAVHPLKVLCRDRKPRGDFRLEPHELTRPDVPC